MEALLRTSRSGVTGRPPYPALMLFKSLLLQRRYTLSDEALEDALCDRRSFRRFVGLGLGESIPDASTLCRFRSDLALRSLGEPLFVTVGRSLDAGGLFVRQGGLIDRSGIWLGTRAPSDRRAWPTARSVLNGSRATKRRSMPTWPKTMLPCAAGSQRRVSQRGDGAAQPS